MIAKRIPKDSEVADDYARLAKYIAAAGDPGEKLHEFWIGNCDAGETLADLDTALVEIEAARKLHQEAKDKTYHLVVSFRPGDQEKLSNNDLKAIAGRYVEALGFDKHQYVAGTHINTDNFHMHVAVNRVNPQTMKVHNPFRDFKTLETISRAIERDYGLAVDRGMSDRQERNPLSPEARDFERHTWQQSFQGYMLEHKDALLTSINEAKDWQAVHWALAEYDVGIRKRGNGMAFVHLKGDQAMKASAFDRSCSKKALEARLGEYQPPRQQREKERKAAQRPPKARYEAKPLVKGNAATSALWQRYLGARRSPKLKSTLFGRTAANWKLFLMSEAYSDPLAMTLLIAHQELLHLFFGDSRQPGRRNSGIAATPAAPEALAVTLADNSIEALVKRAEMLEAKAKKFQEQGLKGTWATDQARQLRREVAEREAEKKGSPRNHSKRKSAAHDKGDGPKRG